MEALNTEPIPTPERFLLLLYSTSIAKYLQDYNLCVESINQSFRPLLVVDAVRTQVVRVSTVLEYFRLSVSGRWTNSGIRRRVCQLTKPTSLS